jgi:hypothetical protein
VRAIIPFLCVGCAILFCALSCFICRV